MKYSFDTDMTLIKGYSIYDDKIVVDYLNGYQLTEDYSKEREKELQDYMIYQAKVRNENVSIAKDIKQRDRKLALTELMASGNLALIIGSLIEPGFQRNPVYLATIGVSFLYSIYFGNECFDNNAKIKELEKYRIYLNMQRELEKSQDPNVFKGVNKKEELNINTLDNYSLKDIKKIDKKLKLARK